MRRVRILSLVLLLLLITGCGDRVVEVKNEDDGRLRLDETHTVDFYLGNDTEGADPITDQVLAALAGTKPESVKAAQGWEFGPDAEIALYRLNGAQIRILRYGAGERVLLDIELGQNHVLSGGVRIGSTEAELRASYGDWPEFCPDPYDIYDEGVRAYVLYGPWYEYYLILFEVDAATGRITSISYELDS